MNNTRQLLIELKGRLDAVYEPPQPDGSRDFECKRQAARVQYSNGGGITVASSGGDANERQKRHRALRALLDKQLVQTTGADRSVQSVRFSEQGFQACEMFLQQGPVDCLCMYLEDMAAYESETPICIEFQDKRWLPFWGVAGVPEWGFSSKARRTRDETILFNTIFDMTSVAARGWVQVAGDAMGNTYYALTEQGRAIAEDKDAVPDMMDVPEPSNAEIKECVQVYGKAKRSERQRIKHTQTHEISLGVPCCGWEPDAVDWVRDHYWRFRNQMFSAECSECSAAVSREKGQLTCSGQCKRARSTRLNKLYTEA